MERSLIVKIQKVLASFASLVSMVYAFSLTGTDALICIGVSVLWAILAEVAN